MNTEERLEQLRPKLDVKTSRRISRERTKEHLAELRESLAETRKMNRRAHCLFPVRDVVGAQVVEELNLPPDCRSYARAGIGNLWSGQKKACGRGRTKERAETRKQENKKESACIYGGD
jgi:hypothetical protein